MRTTSSVSRAVSGKSGRHLAERLVTILNNPLCRTMIFQRTVTTPLSSCLTPRVHSNHYGLHLSIFPDDSRSVLRVNLTVPSRPLLNSGSPPRTFSTPMSEGSRLSHL